MLKDRIVPLLARLGLLRAYHLTKPVPAGKPSLAVPVYRPRRKSGSPGRRHLRGLARH